MKLSRLHLILVTNILITSPSFADVGSTNEWGATNCDAQISLRLKNPVNETNQSVKLSVAVKNVSVGPIHVIQVNLQVPIWFIVTSPSGKDLSTKEPTIPEILTSQISGEVPPNATHGYNFDLASLCKLGEIGTYKVVAKVKIGGNCVATSNPLDVFIPTPMTNTFNKTNNVIRF